MEYIKKQILHERKIGDRQLLINNDGTIELNPGNSKVKITGNLEVTGTSSGPTNSLVYYVSLEGNDTNDGLAAGPDRAKKTIKSAVEAAPVGATIQVAAGNFYENNPITLKERQTVRGDSLRNTLLWPLNNTSDFFFVDNACYIFQVTFRGLRDPGWCVRIKPGALVTVSPYVQNCTNMNGPWLNDGTEFTPFVTEQITGVTPGARPIIDDESVPLAKRVNDTGGGNGMLVDGNDYDQRSLVFSMVADAFTQIAQGGIGFHITNFGYTQIVSCFSVFTRIGFYATKGGYLSISNSVSDFGTYAIISDGVFDELYTTARPVQNYTSRVGSVTVNSTGTGYTSAPTVTISDPEDPAGEAATAVSSIDATRGEVSSITMLTQGSGYKSIPTVTFDGGGPTVTAIATANLIRNQTVTVNSLRDVPQTGSVIQFEGDEQVYYITSTDITTRPFIYDEIVCRRDVRRIVDAVMGDVTMGTNYQALAAGRSYLRATSKIVLFQQLAPTVFGIEAARDEILERVPDSQPLNEQLRYDIIERFAEITTFIENEDSTAAPDVLYKSETAVSDGHNAAKDTLLLNKDFIIEETLQYIRDQFTELSYNQDKCERDVRLLTQAISDDIATGSDYNTTTAGLAYLRANSARVIERQLAITLDAFDNVKTLMLALSEVVASSETQARIEILFTKFFGLVNEDSTDYSIGYPNPIGVSTSKVNTKNQLIINREFIREDVVQYVNNTYPALVYDDAKCSRDVGYIVDALVYDMLYDANTATKINARSYFVGTASQLGTGESVATLAAYEHMKGVITGVISESLITKQAGNILTQDTSGSSGTAVEIETCTGLIEIIRDVIAANSLDDLPNDDVALTAWQDPLVLAASNSLKSQATNFGVATTAYILTNYPDFTYDREKCKRDVGLIIDAIARDVKLASNHNAITAGLAYLRASANVVSTQQLPATIIALREAKRLSLAYVTANTTVTERLTTGWDDVLEIIEFGTLPSVGYEYPAPTTASQDEIDAARQLQENKEFLVAETIAWINDTYFVYDGAKCRRDSELILKAVTDDLVMGTNYNSITAGLAYYNANAGLVISDQISQTIAAVTNLKTNALSYITPDPTSTTTVSNLFDEIIDILQNGVGNADALTWSNPLANVNTTNARTLIQLNRTFAISELISWITANFPALVYNQAKCERDAGYIIDAISYDIQYATNQAIRQAAFVYFTGTESVLPYAQRAETASAYAQLGTILGNIATETYAGQTTNGSPATATESTLIEDLADVIKDVITANTTAVLPAQINLNLSGTSSGAILSRNVIYVTNKTTILDAVIAYINTTLNGFSYNETKCARDTGYLIEAATHDLLYGGNISSLISARSYFDANINQISGQESTTALALTQLRNAASNVIQGIAISPTPGNTETQSLIAGFGTSTEAATSDTLLNITIDAIVAGDLLSTPNNTEPDTSWVNPTITSSLTLLNNGLATIQAGVITYITDNIIAFDYDKVKCARDTSYILDAAIYDMMYGGNKQTRRAAEAYYNGAILGAARVGNADQIQITEFTYKRLATLMSDISQNKTVTKTDENLLNQVYGTIAGSVDAASSLNTNVSKIGEVIYNYVLPTEIDHSYDTQGVVYNNARRIEVLADLQAIEDNAIASLNLQFGGVAELTLFPTLLTVDAGTLASLQNVSTISTSGHAFEYVGAGITYNALPFFGGSAIPENEFVEQNNGKVFAGGTVDQIGNFRVGNFFNVNALTGSITLNADEINLNGIASIGPFKRFGIPVGEELKEVSNAFDLTSSTGQADRNTVPTQIAVKEYVENRYLNKLTGGTVNGNVTLNGDFDVNGNVISTEVVGEFNLLNTSATTINAFGAATSINIGSESGLITLSPDVLVDGSLTVNGNIIFNGDVSLNIPDESLQAYSISTEGSLDYISINTRTDAERITFGVRPTLLVENSTESLSPATGAVVIDGGVGIVKSLYVGVDLTVNGSVALGNDRAVDAIDINGTTDIDIPDNLNGVFRIHENISDYLVIDTNDGTEFVKFGTTPKVTILNNTDAIDSVSGALLVTGGISTQRNIHAGVDITADRDIIADGDIEVNGTNIITDETGTFNVFNTNATQIDAFGAATTINIGAATGILTINNEQVIIDSVQTLQIPVGNTAERPSVATGQIRFNTDTTVFEGYDGIAWGSLGGVKDVDQNTFIRPETSPGANNDELEFFTNGIRRAIISNTEIVFDPTNIVSVNNITESYDYQTGALLIAGGVGIAKNLHVQGFVSGNNSGLLQLTDLASDKILIKAATIESPEQIRWIANSPDSSADDIVYPVSFAHHTLSGTPVIGSGTGVKFELETTNDNFEVGGQIDVVVQDITGAQEDFDMIFSTMIAGSAGVEKLRLSETTSTFSTDITINNNQLLTTQTAFNLLNDTATTINFAGAATVLNIGATGGLTTIDQSVQVNEDVTIDGTLVLTNIDLEVQYGGTGVSTFTENGVVYGDTANPMKVTDAAGTSDASNSFQILTVTSAVDATPVWTDTIDGGTF